MDKVAVTPQCLIPVRPILIIGANVDGKPNFFTAGGGGTAGTDPPIVALSIRHERHTLKGILENRTFSVNIPTVELAREADYCGIVSGEKADKVKDCNFKVFYGKLGTAPMVEQCAINMECTMVHTLSSNSHSIVLGRVDGTYVSQELSAGGKPNLDNLSPLLWFPHKNEYLAIGSTVGKIRSIGDALRTVPKL